MHYQFYNFFCVKVTVAIESYSKLAGYYLTFDQQFVQIMLLFSGLKLVLMQSNLLQRADICYFYQKVFMALLRYSAMNRS